MKNSNFVLFLIVLFTLGVGVAIPIFSKKEEMKTTFTPEILDLEEPIIYGNTVFNVPFFNEDIYYRENGVWKNINLSIKDINIDGYALLVNETWYNAYFKSFSNFGDGVHIINKGCEFTYQAQDYTYRDENGAIYYIDNIQNSPAINTDTIRYNDIFPGVDVEYEFFPKTVKETFIIREKPEAPPEYLGDNISLDIGGYIKFGSNVTVFANGVEQVKDFITNEAIDFYVDEEHVFQLNAPYAIDNVGSNASCFYEVKKQGNQYFFYTRIPYEWFETAELPIRLDPTVNSVEVWDAAVNVYGISAGDVDSDGDGDIIITNDGPDCVYWYENTDGVGRSWTAHNVDTSLSDNPRGAAVGDMDNDGDQDIVAHSYRNEDFKWYENDGSESWTEHAVDGLSAGYADMYGHEVLWDMDGDTYLDIICYDHSDGDIFWLHNDQTPADGGWTEYVVEAACSGVRYIDVQDIDEDGYPDIAAGAQTDGLLWYENDGTPLNGGWTEHTITTDDYSGVSIYDLDGDGDWDILGGTYETHNPDAKWWKNDGSENFKEYSLVDTNGGDAVHGIEATDIDGDGDLDIFLSNYDSKNHSWLDNDGTQNFTQHLVMSTGEDRATDSFVYDIDNNGWDDIVLSSRYNVTWIESTGTNASWQQVTEGNLVFDTSDRIWNQIQQGYLTFEMSDKTWEQTTQGYLTFEMSDKSWHQTNQGYLTFDTSDKSWNQITQGYLIFSSSGREWKASTTEGGLISNFDLSSEGTNAYGVATDGTNIWVVDDGDDEVYKYQMDGTYVNSFDTATHGNTHPTGIGTAGNFLWVADSGTDDVYKYQMDGTFVSSWDTLASGSTQPTGVGTDGTHVWVADKEDDEIYKFTTAGGYVSKFATAACGNDNPYGVGISDTHIFVVDATDDKIYRYQLDGTPDGSFDVTTASDAPRGLGAYGLYIWYSDVTDAEVYKCQPAQGWLVFTTSSKSWEQVSQGWLSFTTPVKTWHQTEQGWLRFDTSDRSWNQHKQGYLIFNTVARMWQQRSQGYLIFNSSGRTWNQIEQGYLIFTTPQKTWNQISQGWLTFSNITGACFTTVQTGNTVRCDGSCSGDVDKYRWSFEHPTEGVGNTSWTDESTWIVTVMDESRIYITLEIQSSSGKIFSVTDYFDIGEERDILDAWEYYHLTNCEDAGFYWWDGACHEEEKPDHWDDYGEGEENESSPDTYDPPVPIKPGGWNFPPELLIIPAIIIGMFLWSRRKKGYTKKTYDTGDNFVDIFEEED